MPAKDSGFQCPPCKLRLFITETAIITTFSAMPGFAYVAVRCSCGVRYRLPPMKFLDVATALGCPSVEYRGFPAPEIVAEYEEMTKRRFPVDDIPLTEREENEIAFFGHLLATQANELLGYPDVA
jgi:hypothetical protein